MPKQKPIRVNPHVIGILVVIFGAYLIMINAPNYVGYIVALLGIALAVKPNAVKHLAYHHEDKIVKKGKKVKK